MTKNVPIGKNMSGWLIRQLVFPDRDFLSPQGKPVGPFCRNGLLPQGEPPRNAHPLHVAALPSFPPRLVAGRGGAAKVFRLNLSTITDSVPSRHSVGWI